MENFNSPQQLGKKAKSSETKAGPDEWQATPWTKFASVFL